MVHRFDNIHPAIKQRYLENVQLHHEALCDPCKEHIVAAITNFEAMGGLVDNLTGICESCRCHLELRKSACDRSLAIIGRKVREYWEVSEPTSVERQKYLETKQMYLERISKLPDREDNHEGMADELLSAKQEVETLGVEIRQVKACCEERKKEYEEVNVLLHSALELVEKKVLDAGEGEKST